MAFNWKTFQTRALTAAIFAAVMLAGLLWNQWSLLVLFSLIHFGCWWEYLKLIEQIRKTQFDIYCKEGFMLAGFAIVLLCCGPSFQIGGYFFSEFSLAFTIAGFVLLINGVVKQPSVNLKSFGAAALGVLYISLSCGLMVKLFYQPVFDPTQQEEFVFFERGASPMDIDIVAPYPFYLPVFIIACMWINDTMAYIVGSLIGKTPFSPISPKKTWEGTIGGIILAGLIVGYAGFKFDRSFVFGHSLPWWIILAIVAAIAGTYGDLLESKLKRMAGVKDSGRIMPGHGGFLDRFDSLLVAIPVVYLYILIFDF